MARHHLVNGKMVPFTTEEEAERDAEEAAFDAAATEKAALRERLAVDNAERLAAKQDAAVMALVNSTPAQCVAWARNNFPTLTQAEQNRLGMLISIMAIAIRPQVRL